MSIMKSWNAYGIFLILSVCFFLGCSNSKDSKNIIVAETNFGEILTSQHNLQFTFNKSVIDQSSVYKYDTSDYFIFEPSIPGTYKWIAANVLEFLPAAVFAPSSEYKISLNKSAFSNSESSIKMLGKEKIEDYETSFFTPLFNLDRTQLFWGKLDDNSDKIELKLNLYFNHNILPEKLKEYLAIFIEDKGVQYSIIGNSISNIVRVSLPSISTDYEKKKLKIILSEGFLCEGGNIPTDNDIESMSYLPSVDHLIINSASTSFINNEALISFGANQSIPEKNIKDFISINPKVDFEIKASSNGFNITGDFKQGNSYDVVIHSSLKGLFGKGMSADYHYTALFGELPPNLKFAETKGQYLSQKGERNIQLEVTNIEELKVKVFKIYENNALHYLRNDGRRNNYYDYYEYDYYDDYGQSNYYFNNDYGQLVYSESISTEKLAGSGDQKLLNVELDKINFYDNKKGIYVLEVSSDKKHWLRVNRLLCLSDIGLITKIGNNDMYVFASSIKDADAIKGAEITVLSTNNQQIASVMTDNDGVAIIPNYKKKFGSFKYMMISARKGEDYNIMSLSKTKMEKSQFDIGGKHIRRDNYDAFLYGERNLYRPGDTINYNLVLRDVNLDNVTNAPIKFEVCQPNGTVYKTFKKETSEEGAASFSTQIPANQITGYWKVKAYTGEDIYLTSKNFSLEEFMPDRIKVETELSSPFFFSDDSIVISGKASNLYGTPAAERNYEVSFTLNKAYFYANNYRDYNFRINNEHRNGSRLIRSSLSDKTSLKGHLRAAFSAEKYKDIGLLRGELYTTVFDETGRPVNRASNFNVYTQDVFYGIKNIPYYWYANTGKTLDFIAVNKDGAPVNAKAKVEILQRYYESVIVNRYGRYRYQSQARYRTIYEETLDFNKNGAKLPFTAVSSGRYEVRIYPEGKENYVSQSFYAYGWGSSNSNSFAINNEGEVEITLDKDNYNTGETAKILFTTPFEGSLIATVEREDVEQHFRLETKDRAASLEVKLTEDHLPNTYISAVAIRKMDGIMMPLTVARGIKPIFSNKPENKINLEITAVEKSRSKTKQKIKIRSSEPKAEVTLAVVDEGILQIKNYQTPNPHGHFYAKRAHEINAYDLYGLLYPEVKKSSMAGGEDNSMSKRTNPLTNKRVRLVSFWSDRLQTNSSGEAEFEIDIPEFSGSLRIMGVAYKEKAFGSAHKNMIVADPIVLSTALPRFATPRDTFLVPVNLANTLDKKTTAKVSIEVDGVLSIIGDKKSKIDLDPKRDGYAYFKIAADPNIGASKVKVKVEAHGEVFTSSTDITVRPPASLTKNTGSAAISGGEKVDIDLRTELLNPSSKLIVSSSPMVQFSKDLDYLVGYPHGCLEQTTSKAFPQMYFSELTKAIKLNRTANKAYNTHYYVQEGVRKIESMQSSNGGYNYWPGGYYHWWGSTYSTHFLVEAQKAGYEVNKTALKRSLDHLSYKVKQKMNTYNYRYRGADNNWYNKLIFPRDALYTLYVLAIAGKYETPSMNYFKSNLDKLSLDSKYLLAAAFALSGDNKSYKEILPKSFTGETSERDSYRSFYSPLRDRALALNALIEVDPQDPQVADLARDITKDLKAGNYYYSTQERSFSFLALGKLAKQNIDYGMKAKIYSDGKTIAEFDGKDLVIESGLENSKISVKAEGKGRVFVYHYTEGIPVDIKVEDVDNKLMVRRDYLHANGNLLNLNQIDQNQIVVVRLRVKTMNRSRLENVAITDLLPAGLEIENPRLTSNMNLGWTPRNDSYESMDVRDDRISYYTTLNSSWKTFHYICRAVSVGKFQVGPVSADAMYDGEYHSYNGATEISIK